MLHVGLSQFVVSFNMLMLLKNRAFSQLTFDVQFCSIGVVLLGALASVNALLEKQHAMLMDGGVGTTELKLGPESLPEDYSGPKGRNKLATNTVKVLGEEQPFEKLSDSTHSSALETTRDKTPVRKSDIRGPGPARDGMGPETGTRTNPIDIIFRHLS